MRTKSIALMMMLGLAATVGACSGDTTEGGEQMQEPEAVEETAPTTEEVAPEGGEGGEGGEG